MITRRHQVSGKAEAEYAADVALGGQFDDLLGQARAAEQEKWLAYYEAQHGVDVARLNVLRHTGTLLAAVK